MVWIGFHPLLANPCGCCGTVVAVGNIQSGYLLKYGGNVLDILVAINQPQGVAHAIFAHKVILGLASDDAVYNGVHIGPLGVGEEHGLQVGALCPYVFHPILLFVSTGELVLFDAALQVVLEVAASHQTILPLAVHSLGVDVVALLLLLNEPLVGLPTLVVLDSFGIYSLVVLVDNGVKVNLGLDDVQQTLLACLGLSLYRVEHVIGARCNLGCQCLWWTYTTKCFNLYHRFSYCVYVLSICLPGICGCRLRRSQQSDLRQPWQRCS